MNRALATTINEPKKIDVQVTPMVLWMKLKSDIKCNLEA
jgi:hypothetical protein